MQNITSDRCIFRCLLILTSSDLSKVTKYLRTVLNICELLDLDLFQVRVQVITIIVVIKWQVILRCVIECIYIIVHLIPILFLHYPRRIRETHHLCCRRCAPPRPTQRYLASVARGNRSGAPARWGRSPPPPMGARCRRRTTGPASRECGPALCGGKTNGSVWVIIIGCYCAVMGTLRSRGCLTQADCLLFKSWLA